MPNQATSKLKGLGRRLLIYEAATGTRVGADGSAVFRVCERLRGPLARLLGLDGFHALLSRAMALAAAEFPSLRALQIQTDGTLGGLREFEEKHDVRVVATGEVVLVAHLLGLLMTFIGPPLTLRLLREIWPNMAEPIF